MNMQTKMLAAILFPAVALAATFRGTDNGQVLTNPDMGLTMHYYSNTPNEYGSRIAPGDDMTWFPGCSIAYLRLPWSMVEPEEGVYDWATIDTPAQRWIARGGQIALRLTCSEDWMYYATPKWVEAAGAKGKHYRLWAGKGPVRTPDRKTLPWDPDFGDPVFLAKLEKFIAALAARYDGRPEVAFVDIGSYGLWGEGHTFGSSQVPEEKRGVDIPRHIDLWCKYFKHTQLVISDDIDGNANRTGKYPVLDYARSKGVGWRDDSILVEPPPRSWYHADQADRYWRTLPVVLEHEHYAGSVQRDAWSQDLLVKSVEDHHASYMSVHGDPRKLLDENREAFGKIARRLGYRFVPKTVTWPDAVKVGPEGEPFEVTFSFANGGVAPCYRDAYPCLTVKDGNGRILAVLADGGFSLKGLLPGAPVSHTAKFRLGRFGAPVFPAGTFDVCLSVGAADGTPAYELPLGDGDGQRRYKIGTISLRKAPFVLQAKPIRFGTWNIRLSTMDKWEKDPRFPKWEARMPRVTGLIEEKGFDLMGLQEVASPQADFIRKAMPGWGLVGVATNDAERSRTSHANGIFYRKDRFRVDDWGWFGLSETPDVPGVKSWGTMCVRACTWARMTDMAANRKFLFFNTHFDHRSQEAREKGMALVLAKIAEKNPGGRLPVILCGDFNSRVESPQIQLAKKTLVRAYEISATTPKGPFRTDNCWRFVPPEKEDSKAGNRIDHIFLTPGTRVTSHETFGDFYGDNFYPSDHFPLKAVIEFAPSAK